MNLRNLVVGGIAVGALCAAALTNVNAQQPETNGTPVQMVVTVEPHKGAEMPNVAANDVMVMEGKNRDRVTDWVPAQGEHAGLEFFILIDDSLTRSVALQFSDIRKFIDEQPNSTQVGIAYMQNGIARIEQNLTNDHALADKALRLPLGIRGANASPYFAITDLAKRWPKSNNRREALVVSDGVDLYYGTGDLLDPYLQSAIEDAQKAGILVSVIYSPGVGHFGHSYWQTYWGQMYLAELSDKTGGESYYIGMTGAPVAFAPYLTDLASRLNHQYILSFTARPEKKAGLRRVKIETEVPKVDLVAPDQVFVPATPE